MMKGAEDVYSIHTPKMQLDNVRVWHAYYNRPHSLAVIIAKNSDDPEREVISINLTDYGHDKLLTGPRDFFIKNYAEFEGLVEALVELDIVRVLTEVSYGPFDATASLVELLVPTEEF